MTTLIVCTVAVWTFVAWWLIAVSVAHVVYKNIERGNRDA